MSLVIINSPGLSTSNAYVSLATCTDVYIPENIHITDTWASLSTNDRSSCIIYATSLLDAEMSWIGTKASSTQSLDWPRTSVYDENGYAVTSTDIPVFLQYACSYFAYDLSQSNRTAESSTLGFSRLDAGSLRMDIDKYDRSETMPVSVYELIKFYGSKTNSQTRILERV